MPITIAHKIHVRHYQSSQFDAELSRRLERNACEMEFRRQLVSDLLAELIDNLAQIDWLLEEQRQLEKQIPDECL